jgi:hypothetical protein
MNEHIRQNAAQTTIDAFKVAAKIYRHSYQVLDTLKEKIKTDNGMRLESQVCNSTQSANDPDTWIYQYRGLYLGRKEFTFDGYKSQEIPVLFLQSSIYSFENSEPLIRYGIIERMYDFSPFQGAKFNEYFKKLLLVMHKDAAPGTIITSHCKAEVEFDEAPLLDIREDSDLLALADKINDKYGSRIINL